MTLKLELWVEGPTDARTHATWAQADAREEASAPAGGALLPLVRKALLASDRMTEQALEEHLPEARISACSLKRKLREAVSLGGSRRRQPQLSNHAWKVMAAIDGTRGRDPSTLVLAVWDRDGDEEQVRDRDRILDVLRSRGETGAAIAVCIEEVEAWLLADGSAFVRCFRRGGPGGGLSSAPEAERDPKQKLMSILDELGVEDDDRAALYRRIAEHIDIDTLTKRCPRGFGELRKALGEFIEPCLGGAAGGAPAEGAQ